MVLKFLPNKYGQTTVEYVLLLAVIISLSVVIFRSEAFSRIFGEESEILKRIVSSIEYSYRNGSQYISKKASSPTVNYNRGVHPSYRGKRASFFSTIDYPDK